MADDESSELSSVLSLSDAPSEDESEIQLKKKGGILQFFHPVKKTEPQSPLEPERSPTPPPPKREPSPPHDYVLADNPDIAFLVMFRSRFNAAFSSRIPNFGPQELEHEVMDTVPGERVELFLCALLGLLLNRKQDVKPGHYNRALEDAIAAHRSQWAKDWEDKSPIAGDATFATMTPTERLTLLKTLALWAMSSSEAIRGIINQSYKQNRHEDDLNQPLSVQPWGSDSEKRRYFLIEGLDDTAFRVYRESNPAGIHNRTWWSVAGSIEELNVLIEKLNTGPKEKKLAAMMTAAIPRFEATEEKRKRREYRQAQKDRFKRPEPGFSAYEGRTRGKRMKYTYSDEEEFWSDSTGARRSMRNTGTHTPAEPAGPVTTASGRQIKAPSRMTVDASNNIVTTNPEDDQERGSRATSQEDIGPTGRPRRSAAVNHSTNGWSGPKDRTAYNSDGDEDESEPELGDEEEEDHVPDESEDDEEEFDEDEEMMDDDEVDDSAKSMVVKLKVPNGTKPDFEKFRYSGPNSNKTPTTTLPTTTEVQLPSAVADQDSTSAAPKKKEATPEPATSGHPTTNGEQDQHPPLTPSSNPLQPTTSLAYRESPDKLQARPLPPPQPVEIMRE